MPRRINPVVKTVEKAATEPVTVAETVVAILENINPDSLAPEVTLEGSCGCTLGATGTEVVIRIRRGTTTAGTLVGKAQASKPGASTPIALSIQELDKPTGEQAGLAYVLTIECPLASTNPSVTGATLTATY